MHAAACSWQACQALAPSIARVAHERLRQPQHGLQLDAPAQLDEELEKAIKVEMRVAQDGAPGDGSRGGAAGWRGK